MRHVIKIPGEFPLGVVVETTPSSVRLGFDFVEYEDGEVVLLDRRWLLLDPDETDQLAASLQAAALELRLKRGAQERGPS